VTMPAEMLVGLLQLGLLLPSPTRTPPRAVPPRLCGAKIFTFDPVLSAELARAQPSPALQPREVISTVMTALHRSNFDCDVALRFLAPSNPASRATAERFASYLQQTWYVPLLSWSDYRWEGDCTLLGESEAYQQLSVRADADAPWTSVRWILRRVPHYASSEQWMVEAVFVAEPDGTVEESTPLRLSGEENRIAIPNVAPRSYPSSSEVVLEVMRALRSRDDPYPYHGCEVAIRYCSPTNRASRLSPQAFAQYLAEPWYKILTEWEDLDEPLDEPEIVDDDGATISQDVLVRRAGYDSWTIVNWQLSRYSGRWLMDALSITE